MWCPILAWLETGFDEYTLQGRALLGPGVVEASLVVRRGVVARVCKGYTCRAGRIVRLDNRLVILPGVIDMHVHLRGLRLSYKEDEESGTLAAAAGGVTFVADMPNTSPRVSSMEVLREKLEALRARAYVDYGVYVGYTSDLRELDRMLGVERVLGLKLYPEDLQHLNNSIVGLVEKHGRLLVVHCEHPAYISEDCGAGERSRCRPILAEVECITAYSQFFKKTRTHVTHVTSPRLLLEAKRRGFTVDTCPHYVLLDQEYERRLGCIAKVNPPLRPPRVRARLLKYLSWGLVDVWATDHAPHSIVEKQSGIRECPPGIPGLETSLKLLLTLVNKGLLSLESVATLTNRNPARILGLQGYGCLEPGCTASFTVVDLKREGVIDPTRFYSKAKYTPFSGFRYRGEPVATIVRGYPVYIEGHEPLKPRLEG